MKKKTIKREPIPKPLTEIEEQMLEDCFFLPGWQFDETIKRQCVLIQKLTIGTYTIKSEDGKTNYEDDTALLYGHECLTGESKEKGIASFFIRYGCTLYQSLSIISAMELLDIMKKNFKREEYEHTKFEEKEKKYRNNFRL